MNHMRVCSIRFVVLKFLGIFWCLYSLLKCLAAAYLPRKVRKSKSSKNGDQNNESKSCASEKNDDYEKIVDEPQGPQSSIILLNPLVLLSHTNSYLLAILFNIMGLGCFMMAPNSIIEDPGVETTVTYMNGCYLDSATILVYIGLFWHLSV